MKQNKTLTLLNVTPTLMVTTMSDLIKIDMDLHILFTYFILFRYFIYIKNTIDCEIQTNIPNNELEPFVLKQTQNAANHLF